MAGTQRGGRRNCWGRSPEQRTSPPESESLAGAGLAGLPAPSRRPPETLGSPAQDFVSRRLRHRRPRSLPLVTVHAGAPISAGCHRRICSPRCQIPRPPWSRALGRRWESLSRSASPCPVLL
ncbi:unnamed protein product [Cuscuta campestris]|uniref:Uncharacterized protein n=1 Tax=Cuscuta campestris TaxID=132261 RepID=A0A484MZ60_9ASTE|nr:unnamed protein product [Cuscuta campestris]